MNLFNATLARRFLAMLGGTFRTGAATERTILVVTNDPGCAHEALDRFNNEDPTARLIWMPRAGDALERLKHERVDVVVIDPGPRTFSQDRLALFVEAARKAPVWLIADDLAPSARTLAVQQGATGVFHRQHGAATAGIPSLRLKA